MSGWEARSVWVVEHHGPKHRSIDYRREGGQVSEGLGWEPDSWGPVGV